jgi:DNA-binding GntR family transcriptional regulator
MPKADLERINYLPLNDIVYERIKDHVLSGEFGPGRKLSLHSLADDLEVSRSPVHQALTRLEAERLVTVQPRRGYFVRPLRGKDLLDEYDVRLALELQAAERAVGKLTVEQRGEVEAGLEETVAAATGGRIRDLHVFVKANERFHQTLIDAAGSVPLSEVYKRLNVNMVTERILRQSGIGAAPLDDILDEHRAIVNAYVGGDLSAAQETIRAHVGSGKALVRRATEVAGDWL